MPNNTLSYQFRNTHMYVELGIDNESIGYDFVVVFI